MDTFIYRPTYKENEKLVFEGTIELRVPAYESRIQSISGIKYKMDAENKMVLNDESIMPLALTSHKLVKDHVVKVDLVFVQTGKKFDSLKAIEPFRQYQGLIGDLSNVLMNGLDLGEV